jgi:thiol:disulfide interchange protein DsbD
MEENVWSNKEVFKILNNDIVLVSLYVDDRNELIKENQFSIKRPNGTLKMIKTIGQKWSTFQYLNFKTASQPFYVLITSEGNLLNEPIQYVDIATFKNWLYKGLEAFDNKQLLK